MYKVFFASLLFILMTAFMPTNDLMAHRGHGGHRWSGHHHGWNQGFYRGNWYGGASPYYYNYNYPRYYYPRYYYPYSDRYYYHDRGAYIRGPGVSFYISG